jgi:hypothetical protein
MPLMDFAWATPLRRRVTVFSGLIIAVTGAIVGVDKAVPVVEPWWYVNRQLLRDTKADITKDRKVAENQIIRKLDSIQLDVSRGKLDNTDNDIAKWNNELAKPDTDRDLANKSLRKLDQDKRALERQIKTLEEEVNRP